MPVRDPQALFVEQLDDDVADVDGTIAIAVLQDLQAAEGLV